MWSLCGMLVGDAFSVLLCWLCRDSVCWRCFVPVREMLPMSAVLPVCICVCVCVCVGGGPLDAVWCSWVFTVYVCVCYMGGSSPWGPYRFAVVDVLYVFCVLPVPYLENLSGMHVWCHGEFGCPVCFLPL